MKTKFIPIFLLIAMFASILSFQIVIPMISVNVSATESTINPENPGDIPITSTEEAEAKIEEKAYNIVSLLQTIGKPICIVGFIISILAAVFGAIGKKGATGGLVGAFIAAFAYICINYAPEIVVFIQTYIIS